MTLCTIVVMAVLGGAHPYRVVKRNYVALVDEFIILVITDLLLFSSDPGVDADSREYLGWAIVGILGVSIIYSQGGLLITAGRDFCRAMRIRKYKKAYMKKVNEMEERQKMPQRQKEN